MTKASSFLLAALFATTTAFCQTTPVELSAHTPLTVQISRHAPMRIGQPIHAELLYPVYSGETLVLPAHTIVSGKVVGFRSDRAKRVRSAFNLDFTPFHIPVVQFTQLKLPDGETLDISTTATTDGAVIAHLVASHPHRKENIVRQEFDNIVHFTRDSVLFFVAPGKGDRLLQLAYHQLPWHPQRIEAGTAWTAEVAQTVAVPPQVQMSHIPSSTIEATLDETLSSQTAEPGQTIHATVAAPVYRPDHTLAIPQGATLAGTITQAKPSRKFGRAGSLRFAFDKVVLPDGQQQDLAVDLAGADSSSQQDLVLDTEGDVKPRPQDKLIVPAILIAFAVAPLDPDPGDNDEFIKNAGASNSLGVAGFIAGVAVNSVNVSAGFGFYGAALSINDRWIRRGPEVVFPRYSRLVLKVSAHAATP